MARSRKPKTLLEVNVVLAANIYVDGEKRRPGKRLPLAEQARVMVKAMPKATRVAEFIALWAITKNLDGEVTMEGLAERWDEPLRTMYRRLEEFREVWGQAGMDTPDKLADGLISDYRRRKESMSMRHVAKLLSAPVPSPTGDNQVSSP